MPTVFEQDGYRFFFFSNENHEPSHVHIERGEFACKWWLEPIKLAKNYGMTTKQLSRIESIIEDRHSELVRKWNAYFKK